ncbi:MAG: acyl-CoA dehydrogenase family protein [Cyanobacteria bacterium J06627_28]
MIVQTRHSAHLETLQQHLTKAVQPIAHSLDADSSALFGAFEQLANLGLLLPKTPEEFGGLGLDASAYQQFQSGVARYSGALAFLQTQHQSAASLLLSGENDYLAQQYLPQMATGKIGLGVGFSQLRRQPPTLTATPVNNGYLLSGEVPWVSGYGLFTEFVGAAVLPTGEAVFGLLPLTSQQLNGQQLNGQQLTGQQTTGQQTTGQLVVSQPMRLAGMNATNTVQVFLEDWILPAEKVVGRRAAGWIEERDRANPLSPLGLIFGCSQGALDVLTQSLERRGIKHGIAQQLQMKLAWQQTNAARVTALPPDAYPQKLALRGRAISLMNTCAQAAIVAASGAANAPDHPAQRIHQESLVFSVSGQTTDGAAATLDSLLSSL